MWLDLDRLGRIRRCLNRGGRCCRRLGFRLLDVDAAFEEGAVFDADARRGHITGQSALGTDVHPVTGGDVAAHLAQNDDLTGTDAGRDLAIAAHGHAIAGQIDAAFDLAIDKERFSAGDLSLDEQALADGGLVADRDVRAGARVQRRALELWGGRVRERG